jgi:hypothetical protein
VAPPELVHAGKIDLGEEGSGSQGTGVLADNCGEHSGVNEGVVRDLSMTASKQMDGGGGVLFGGRGG